MNSTITLPTPLTETVVRDQCVQFLEGYYGQKFHTKQVYAGVEAVRAGKNKWRADGLIAFRQPDGSCFVASVEAKSYKTLYAIKEARYPDDLLAKEALLAGALIAGATWWIFLRDSPWYVTLILCLLVFLIAVFGYGRAMGKLNLARHQAFQIIDQVKYYPGNEQWICFSEDCFNQTTSLSKERLEATARRKGVGMIVIAADTDPKVLCSPRYKAARRGKDGFLSCYARASQIMDCLGTP